MQLLQCGNLTPKNVVCCGPCDDPEYNLQQGRLRKTDSGNSQTIPFTRNLGHFRISLTGLLGEWKQGKVRGRTRIEFLSFESFPIQFSF